MNLKLHILSLSALLFAFTPVWAEESGENTICELPRPPQPRKSAQPVRPEISLVCGSNTVSQTVSMQPTPTTTTVQTPSGNVPTASSTLIALISAAAGVFGALAGGLVSYLVARQKAKSDLELETKRLQANLVATERLRWLQDIRERFSNLYKQLDMQYSFAKRPVAPNNIATIQKQLDEMSSEIIEQCNMIMLMLNPAKPDQAKLYDTLQLVLTFILRIFQQTPARITNLDDSEYATYKQAAFDAMTSLGVETWRQVKSLS
ncbi:hypothetical protein ISO89_17690 [Morganella morganii subsp. morganii]|uniref:hypothetical protein n=1 Tax=Morganella morganii TaxID=582 RepID=UPI0005C6321B|nr:hypothetical protein [Morganella morganii]MBT0311611.1 hypothetical protein [Morganella morganii subsp. morganii]HAT2781394.1 hypothetical protein [Citrobacter koseri]HCC6169037.1 hypothetical protein [Citrobacter amalonaticus]HCC7018507.1 hypothetical protein [Citrobacter amalonaticus]